jgi:hypothetical protein
MSVPEERIENTRLPNTVLRRVFAIDGWLVGEIFLTLSQLSRLHPNGGLLRMQPRPRGAYLSLR